MINIDFLTLKAFFTENVDFFINSRLQKIQQPTRRDFIFMLRNNGESRKLYININPQIYHIAFMSKENEKKRNIEIPQKPPMFCMLLRKYLEGAKIIDANVVENERILELYFETFDELSQNHNLCLCIELMGKHSNIILYDRDTAIIVGCAHNVGAEKSRYRELQGGLKYIYPPANSAVKLSNELSNQFRGLSQDDINKYLSAETFTPAVLNDRYTLFQELIEGSERQKSVNDMLDDYYANVQQNKNLTSAKNMLKEIVTSKLKKIKNAETKIKSLLEKRDKTKLYRRYGELLTANIYKKCDFQKNITLFDYSLNENITVELDETKTISENAQRYFHLYTKSKNTKEKAQNMLDKLVMEHKYNEDLLYSIDVSENITELEEIKYEMGINTEKKYKQKNINNTPEKIKIDGFDVYIGKNNKQNDYIVSNIAKDEDLWFHIKACAGSHVLLKTSGHEPGEKTLFECCKLARKYSSASQPSKVGVIYTKAKYLKKPPASPLGYVTYKNEAEVLV